MATHSSVLAWRIPGTREPGGLPSMGSHRVGHDLSDLAVAVSSSRQIPIKKACGKYSTNIRVKEIWCHIFVSVNYINCWRKEEDTNDIIIE